MATKQTNNLLSEEKKLKDQLIKAEKALNAEREKGKQGDKVKLASLDKELEKRQAAVDKFKLQNAEAKTSLDFSKLLIKSAEKHKNLLIRQTGLVQGITSISNQINQLARSKDKVDKKLVKNYQASLDLTQSIMQNTKTIGTDEFQKVNITAQIVKLKKLEQEATTKTKKDGITAAVTTLELMKEAQDIMEAQHESAKSAADSIMAPFKFITDTLGNVPVIGGLVQKTLGSQVQSLTDSLSAKIGSALSEGMEKAPTDVKGDAFNKFRQSVSKKAGGEGYKKGDWAKEKKNREDNAKMSKKDVTAAKMRGKLMAASIAGLAVVAGLWAKIGKYAMDTGLSLQQVASLGPQLLINSQAVEAFADEFGTVGELSTGLALDLRKQRALYGAQEKDVAKLLKLQQGMTGATKEQIVSDLPGMYKDARKAGVSPAKLMENMAGSSEFLAKYVGGSVKEMGAFAIQAAKSGVSLQAIEASMKGALDWETSIGKEMEASMLLGREINLDRFRQLSFAGDAEGAMSEQLRILKSFGPLENLRIDQKEMLGDLFNTEFSSIVSMQREQDILNDATSKQTGFWTAAKGSLLTYGSTFLGFMPSVLMMGSQMSMMFSPTGGIIKGLGSMVKWIKNLNIVTKIGTSLSLAHASAKAAMASSGFFAAAAAGSGVTLGFGTLAMVAIAAAAIGAMVSGMAKARNAVPGKASGGPVKGMNPYMVGERGPELFIPATGGNIVPNHRMADGTTGGNEWGGGMQALLTDIRDATIAGNADRKTGNKDLKGSIWDASRTQ